MDAAKAPAQPAAQKLLLTPDEVSAQLDVSRATVLRKAKLGEYPGAFRMPGVKGQWRFKRAVFEAWVQRGCPPQPITRPGS